MSSRVLTPWVSNVLRFIINYAHFYRILPMRWPQSTGTVDFAEYSYNPLSRHGILYALAIFEVFIITRCYIDITNFNIERFGVLIMELLALSCNTMICVFQYSALRLGRLLVLVLNQYMLNFRKIETCYSPPSPKTPEFQKELLLAGCMLIAVSIFAPLMVFAQWLLEPDLPYFITSLLLEDVSSFPLWAKCLLGIPTTWFFLAIWACYSGCGIIFYYEISTTIYLLSELRPRDSSDYTTNEIRHHFNVIRIYKNLQLLISGLNGISQNYLIVFIINTVIIITVFSNFVLIRYHSGIPIQIFVMILTVAAVGATVLIVTHIQFGEVNKMATRMLNSWRKNRKSVFLNTLDRCLVAKYFKSFLPLRVHYGSFGVFDKPSTMRIIGKLVAYTVKFLMLMKKVL